MWRRMLGSCSSSPRCPGRRAARSIRSMPRMTSLRQRAAASTSSWRTTAPPLRRTGRRSRPIRTRTAPTATTSTPRSPGSTSPAEVTRRATATRRSTSPCPPTTGSPGRRRPRCPAGARRSACLATSSTRRKVPMPATSTVIPTWRCFPTATWLSRTRTRTRPASTSRCLPSTAGRPEAPQRARPSSGADRRTRWQTR